MAYEALCLFFTSPLVLFSTSILTTMKRTAFRMPKVHFICVVVVVWWFYEYVFALFQQVEVEVYIHNLQADPCFVQPGFFSERTKFLFDTCRELRRLQGNYTNTGSTLGTQRDSLAFCSAQCPGPKYCTPLTGLTASSRAYADSVGVFAGLDRCDDMLALKQKYLRAPDTPGSVNGEFWYSSGIVAQLGMKILLCNFIMSTLYFVDPLCPYGGKYETARKGGLGDPVALCTEVQQMLRFREARKVLLWGLTSGVALANLVYASSKNNRGAWDDFNLATIVVVAVAGLLLLGNVAYYTRRWCGDRLVRQCAACCGSAKSKAERPVTQPEL